MGGYSLINLRLNFNTAQLTILMEGAIAMPTKRKIVKSESVWRRVGLWVGGIMGASLIGAALVFLYYWLGLDPSTTEVQPLGASIPIRIYSGGVESVIFQYAHIWAPFKSQPSEGMTPEEVSAIEDWDTAITLTGELSFGFDVESVAAKYEVIVNSIDLAVIRNEPQDVTPLMFLSPALGGGGFALYELNLSNASPISTVGETQIYRTKLASVDGQAFDFVTLMPAERESVRVDLLLDKEGLYAITPIVNYSFRERSESLYADTQKIIYPRLYIGWSNGWQNEPMRPSNILVNPRTGQVTDLRVTPETNRSCLPSRGQVLFSSGMITFGSLPTVFAYDFSDNSIYQVSPFHFQSGANVTRQDGLLLSGLWSYDHPLKRKIPFKVYEYNPVTHSGRMIASEASAAEYEKILNLPPEEDVRSVIFAEQWEAYITGQNEFKNTDLMLRRLDGTCETILISNAEAHLYSLFP